MGADKQECHVLQCVRNGMGIGCSSTPEAEDDCVTGEDELECTVDH